MHFGKYDDINRSDRSRSLVGVDMIAAIADAIAEIEPDPIPAIAIVTIAGIVNSDVSI